MQTRKKLRKKILSLALSATMVFTMFPATAFAAEGGTTLGASSVGEIKSFYKLGEPFVAGTGEGASPNVYGLSVALDTPEDELNLPTELMAMVARTTTVSKPAEDEDIVDSGKVDEPAVDENTPDEDEPANDTVSGNQPASPSDAEEVKEEIEADKVPLSPEPEQDKEATVTTTESETIPVTWNSNKTFTSEQNGGPFIFTAELPEGYILADGVKAPQIYVFVGNKQVRAAVTVTEGTVTALQTAFSNANDGDTILLGADITIKGNETIYQSKEITLTLDLNGHTISGTTSRAGLVLAGSIYGGVIVDASLIIKDSSGGNGKILITSGYGTATAVCNGGSGTVKIESGTLASSSPDGAQALAVRGGGGEIVITGGVLEYTGTGIGYALLSMSGKTTITGGEIRSTQEGSGSAIMANTEVAISGGTITSKCTSSTNGTIQSNGSNANVIITAGMVSNTANPEGYSVYLDRDGKVTQTGGTVGRIGPAYKVQGTIKGSDTNSGIAATLQLKNSAGTNVGTAVTAAADGTYTIKDVLPGNGYTITVTCNGYSAGTIPSFTVNMSDVKNKNLTLEKSLLADYTGVEAAAPNGTPVSKSDTAITLAAVTVAGETVEYAYNTTNNAPTTGWQDSTAFTGLTADTTYYFFARVKENTIHTAGATSTGTAIKTEQSEAQRVAAAKITAQTTLTNFTATNATTAADVLSAVNSALSGTGVTAAWNTPDDFNKTLATDSAAGSITGTIKLTCGNASDTVSVNLSIAQLGGDLDKVNQAKPLAENAINGINASNSTTAASILSTVNSAISSVPGVTATWKDGSPTITQATTSAAGSITGTIVLTCGTESVEITVNKTIAKLSGGGSTGGGGGSSSGGSNSTTTTPTKDSLTNGQTTVTAPVDQNGNATVTVTDKAVADAIKAAQEQAKKEGLQGKLISVEIVAATDKATTQVTATLPLTVQNTLIGNKVDSVKITTDTVTMTFSQTAIQQINGQAKADVTITAAKADTGKLTGNAKALIGSRPMFDFNATYGGDKRITNFGGNTVSIAIPYTLGAGEVPGNLYGIYVDGNGKATKITNSSYDANLKAVIFTTSHFSKYGVGYQASYNFTDIANHWAKTDIEFTANRGLLTGTSNTTFSPDAAMTRGMFVTALGRLAGIDPNNYKTGSFTDVPATAYYAPYVNWAASKGITSGTTATTFSPDSIVTRQEMAVFMANYAKAMGYKVPETRAANTFADNASISSWAANAVKAMQMAGVLNGKSGNKFDPAASATRAEVAAVLHRYVSLVIDPATAQGLDTNDSGNAMMYENGKAVKSASRTVSGTTYNFDANGEAALLPTDSKKTGTYTVQKGDSFWLIAKKNNCTIAELEALNGKSRNDIIYAGQVLKVPQK